MFWIYLYWRSMYNMIQLASIACAGKQKCCNKKIRLLGLSKLIWSSRWSVRKRKNTLMQCLNYIIIYNIMFVNVLFFFTEVVNLIRILKKDLCWNTYRFINIPLEKLLLGQFIFLISLYIIYNKAYFVFQS